MVHLYESFEELASASKQKNETKPEQQTQSTQSVAKPKDGLEETMQQQQQQQQAQATPAASLRRDFNQAAPDRPALTLVSSASAVQPNMLHQWQTRPDNQDIRDRQAQMQQPQF